MLGSAAKRQVYDIYGKEGLAAGLQVVPSGKSTEELKKDWEGFRTQQVRPASTQDSCVQAPIQRGRLATGGAGLVRPGLSRVC